MSKKKEKSLLREVEEEIHRLSEHEGDSPGPESPADMKEFMGQLLKQQHQQHVDLLRTITESSQSNCRAVVDAVKEIVQPVPPPVAPPPVAPPPVARTDAETPPQRLFDEGDESSDEEFDFTGWDLPQSGQAQEIYEPVVQIPSTSASTRSAPVENPAQENAPPILDSGLFHDYENEPNWHPPLDLMVWLKDIENKEVPAKSVKDISELFNFFFLINSSFIRYCLVFLILDF